MSMRGLQLRAMAIMARCLMPPGKLMRILIDALFRQRYADQAQHVYRPRFGLVLADVLMKQNGFP